MLVLKNIVRSGLFGAMLRVDFFHRDINPIVALIPLFIRVIGICVAVVIVSSRCFHLLLNFKHLGPFFGWTP